MLPPEATYQFRQLIDQSSSALQIVHREVSFSVAASPVGGVLYTVPNDRVLILGAFNCIAQGGGAQIAQSMSGRIAGDIGNPLEFATEPIQAVGAGTQLRLTWSGQIFCPPGATIEVNAQFSAAAVANTVTGRCFGVSIPRANIAQG